jgi:hypothetical protein
MCWTIIRGYLSMYWKIYLLCVGYIVYCLFVHYYYKCVLNDIPNFLCFLSIFHFPPTIPQLELKPTSKPKHRPAYRSNRQVSRFQFEQFQKSNFQLKTGQFHRLSVKPVPTGNASSNYKLSPACETRCERMLGEMSILKLCSCHILKGEEDSREDNDLCASVQSITYIH